MEYGITADTGGHIAYILDAARYQALQSETHHVTVVTRAFTDRRLAKVHAQATENVALRVTIQRILTTLSAYLEKDELTKDLPAFTTAFCNYLGGLTHRPDVIHAHFADAAAVAISAERRFGIPFVFTPHALGIDKRKHGITNNGLDLRIAAERQAITAASAIIVSSRDEAERQIAAYGIATADRVHCISPGPPSRSRQSGGPNLVNRLDSWLTDPSLPIILAIARPVKKKNLIALVSAYAGDATLRARANLVILSGRHDNAQDEERAVLDELREFSSSPDLVGRIVLPPRHNEQDVAALYALAAKGGVFVNPAFHEPFGLTLLEAAEAGVPVVATANGGSADIVARIGHGILIDPHDHLSIAAAIRSIITDAQCHMSFAAAGRTGIQHYNWDEYAAASIAVYRKLSTPRILACDIDNTLAGSLSGAVRFAAWRKKRSLPFVVATGRGIDAARLILRQWQLPEPDAFIVDVGTRLLVPDANAGWRECLTYRQTLDIDWNRGAVQRTVASLGVVAQSADTAGPHKLSFFGDSADAAIIRQALATAGLAARVIFSHGNLIDVIAINAGKANAVAAYAARYGLTLAQCVAVGDSGNDADMLAACGHAIIVANADEELATLPVRHGLHRAVNRYAYGVIEGLAQLGLLAITPPDAVAA